jgi:hypothetical protein
MVDQVLAASKARLTPGDLGSSDGHKKYRGLLKERSSYFWAVAPGVRRAFAVEYESDAAILNEIADLPSYGAFCQLRVELGAVPSPWDESGMLVLQPLHHVIAQPHG